MQLSDVLNLCCAERRCLKTILALEVAALFINYGAVVLWPLVDDEPCTTVTKAACQLHLLVWSNLSLYYKRKSHHLLTIPRFVMKTSDELMAAETSRNLLLPPPLLPCK